MSLEIDLLDKIAKIKKQSNSSQKDTKINKTTNIEQIEISQITPISDDSLIKNIDDKDKDEWISLRTKYANKIYYLLCAEIAFLFLLIILLGFEIIKLEDSTINITIGAVITQSFFLVKEIVTNLFKKNS